MRRPILIIAVMVIVGVADTEQHFFVESTVDGTLKSVYWVQYEAYLPDNSYTYNYDDSPLRVALNSSRNDVEQAHLNRTRETLSVLKTQTTAGTVPGWPARSSAER